MATKEDYRQVPKKRIRVGGRGLHLLLCVLRTFLIRTPENSTWFS